MQTLTLLLAAGLIWLLVRSGNDRAAIDELTQRLGDLERRVHAGAVATAAPALEPTRMEAAHAAPPVPFRNPASLEGAAATEVPRSTPLPVTTAARERSRLERVVAEHTLAIIGGVFVLIAAVLFVTFAIDQGWIGPWLRFGLSLALAGALVAASQFAAQRMPVHARVGQALGSLHGVLAGTGVAVAFLAIVAAVRLEGILGAAAGAVLQALVAAGAVWIARGWRSQDLAAFGVCVGVAAPMLVGAEATPATIALLVSTLVAAAALAAWEHWPRLWLAAVVLSAPQVASYAHGSSAEATVSVLVAWWALVIAGCSACALRDEKGARRSVVAAVFVAATVVAGRIFDVYDTPMQLTGDADGRRAIAFGVFGGLHVLAAGALVTLARRRERSIALAVAILGAGATVIAIAIGDAGSGVSSVAGWAFEAVALMAVAAYVQSRATALFAGAAALLAIGRAFLVEAPLDLLYSPPLELVPPVAAVLTVLVAAGSARLVLARLPNLEPHVRDATARGCDVLIAGSAWYAVALALAHEFQPTVGVDLLGAAWAGAGGLVFAVLAGPARHREWLALAALVVAIQAYTFDADRYLRADTLWVVTPLLIAACSLAARPSRRIRPEDALAFAAAQGVIMFVSVLLRIPPSALRDAAVGSLVGATQALIAIVASTWLLAWAVDRWDGAPADLRRAGWFARAAVTWYATSALVVALLTREPGAVEQGAQLALTLTWIAMGIGALLAGTSARLRHLRELRIGGYGLLALGAAKLVLVDSADFETPMRVVAFLATGLGLLGSAALEQRMRSDEPPAP